MQRASVLLLGLVITGLPLSAQQSSCSIFGSVHERSGPLVPGAEVQIQNELTGARQRLYSDGASHFASRALTAGTYKITTRLHGFRTVSHSNVFLKAGTSLNVDLTIDLLRLQQQVTVRTSLESNSDSNAITVTPASPEATLPSNGRDLHTLFSLLPGAVITPAAIGDGGQFTVNGQRPNTNSFRVDGVSANTGVGSNVAPGAFPGSSLPGMTAIGSTQSLSSQEEIADVSLRSSEFAPETGDQPGAQIRLETRSGSNAFHGSVYGYDRPGLFDGYDWFASSCEVPLSKPSTEGLGASLGGPISQNKTFFFASWEMASVDDFALQLTSVPSLAARVTAPLSYQGILDAFPPPNGCHRIVRASIGSLINHETGAISNYGIRLDQTLGSNAKLFLRVSSVPSSARTLNLEQGDTHLRWTSATAGLSAVEVQGWSTTFRINFSRADADSSWQSSLTGVGPLNALQALLPAANGQSLVGLSIAGVGQIAAGLGGRSSQNQWEANGLMAKLSAHHEIRAGGDIIRLTPRRASAIQSISAVGQSVDALVANGPLSITVSSLLPESVNIHLGALFLQDTWQLTPRLTLLYGARWEITPPVAAERVSFPEFGYWYGPGTAPQWLGNLTNAESSNWSMSYTQIAPRAGAAYRLSNRGLVLRSGAGLFYDSGLASALNPVNGSPFDRWQFQTTAGASNTLTPHELVSSSIPAAPAIHLPRVLGWRTSLEQRIHEAALLSLAYIGSSGQSLLRQEAYLSPNTNLLAALQLTSHGYANYHALQMQFNGDLAPGLRGMVSYTWAHSIDNGSQSSSVFLVQPSMPSNDRGSSSFDVRQIASFALTYHLPHPPISRYLRPLLNSWNLSTTLQARTGFPIEVTTGDQSLGLGFENAERPNLVTGIPLWISDAFDPGGRALNPSAFAPTSDGTQGSLGRNTLYGSPLFQADLSLRRRFHLYGPISLEATISSFNVLNHPAFANPVQYLLSPWFGRPTSMANLMLGAGSPSSGLTPLFQSGGPRTFETGLRFTF